jgi:hypothetical protein
LLAVNVRLRRLPVRHHHSQVRHDATEGRTVGSEATRSASLACSRVRLAARNASIVFLPVAATRSTDTTTGMAVLVPAGGGWQVAHTGHTLRV